MRAAFVERFTGPVGIREVPVPNPGPGEVLVRMEVVSLNSWDHELWAGTSFGRIGSPFRPQHAVLGADLAGVVEKVGPGVTRFQPGDAVFGDVSSGRHWGGLAEYAVADEKLLIKKADGLSFEQAACLPQGGYLALQGLRRKGEVRPGNKVLITGAGGGMGHLAVQLAKHMGAEVTAVDRASKVEFMRSMGADHAIGFEDTDFTATGERYDLILDAVANRSMRVYASALTERGRFVVVGGTVRAILAVLTLGSMMSKPDGKWLGIVPIAAVPADLEELQSLVLDGTLVPHVDQVYPLEEAETAIKRFGVGDIQGKVLVRPTG